MMEIEYAYVTHPGRFRRINQDNLVCGRDYLPLEHHKTAEPVTGIAAPSGPLLLGVFDGMGGEEHGETASFLAAETAARSRPVNERDLDALCREMNRKICDYVADYRIRSSGSTASLLLFSPRGVTCCHIGDSRIYRCRGKTAVQLTKDDVWPYARGGKAPLLQCLGIPEDEMRIRPHLDQYPLEPQDVYMLCTDGLTDAVGLDRISEILSGDMSLKDMAQTLLQQALEEDGRDNVTIFLGRAVGI